MARYYEPRNGVFLSLDPDPGSDGDSLDQNGYAYGNNNPVMNVDPDGHWVWMVAGALIGGISSYKAAKAKGARGWRLAGSVALGAAGGAIGGNYLRVGRTLYKAGKLSKTYWNARKVAKANKGVISRASNNKGWVVTTKKHIVRLMGRNSGKRKRPYYRMSRKNKGSLNAKGHYSHSRAETHIKLRWHSYRNINKRLRQGR